MRRLVPRATLLLGLALAAGGALADPGKAARLEAAALATLPLGEMFAMLGADDPNWPLQDRAGDFSRGQLACLRGELSVDGERRRLRPLATRYVADHAEHVDADLAVLEPAARPFGLLMLAGARQEQTGVEMDAGQVLADVPKSQQDALVRMMSSPDFSHLRQFLGLEDAFDASASVEENEASGEAAGADLATRVISRALDICELPQSLLDE